MKIIQNVCSDIHIGFIIFILIFIIPLLYNIVSVTINASVGSKRNKSGDTEACISVSAPEC
jgi:hypothetical protein